MSEGPVRLMEVCYEFDCNALLHELIDVCLSVRNLAGVADVELCRAFATGGEAPISKYKIMVILESKTAIGTIQEYLGQYRDKVTNLKVGLYMGTYQKLD